MAILLFSFVVLIGLIPAVHCLDRLFAINFERSAGMRPSSKDVFWQPRGFAETGTKRDSEVTQRPIGEGIAWLLKTPGTFADDAPAGTLLRVYRFSAGLILVGILGLALFLFVF